MYHVMVIFIVGGLDEIQSPKIQMQYRGNHNSLPSDICRAKRTNAKNLVVV